TGTTTATLVGNTIHDHGTGQSVGVFVGDGGSFARDAAAPTTGLTMVRNRIIGGSDGVEGNGTRAPVTMFGDVIARNTFDAVQANSIEVDPPGGIYLGGDLSVTNATIANNNNLGSELQDNHLTLDSSIVQNGIFTLDGDQTATCTITFSDGMTTNPGGTGCE